MGPKRGKMWGEKGRRNDDKRGTKGGEEAKRRGNYDKRGQNVAIQI